MANDKKYDEQDLKLWQDLRQDHLKHWRSWGSWFSWGSPVGLGLFFLALAGAVWILGKTFHW